MGCELLPRRLGHHRQTSRRVPDLRRRRIHGERRAARRRYVDAAAQASAERTAHQSGQCRPDQHGQQPDDHDVQSKISLFKPDLLLYQRLERADRLGRLAQIEAQLGAVTNGLHKALHYKSMLYTYLVEKYSFTTTKDVKLWKIDVKQMQDNLDRLTRVVRKSGAQFVFITQVTRTPRTWKASIRSTPTRSKRCSVGWNPIFVRVRHRGDQRAESAACGDRSVELFRRLNVPIINILDEVRSPRR